MRSSLFQPDTAQCSGRCHQGQGRARISAENDQSRHSSVVFQLVNGGFEVWLDVQSCEVPLPFFDGAHSALRAECVPARPPASLPVVTPTRALGRVWAFVVVLAFSRHVRMSDPLPAEFGPSAARPERRRRICVQLNRQTGPARPIVGHCVADAGGVIPGPSARRAPAPRVRRAQRSGAIGQPGRTTPPPSYVTSSSKERQGVRALRLLP